MPGDFADLTRPQIERLLQPGETLRGVAAAVHQKTFSGTLYAIGVTNRRLVLLPVDRHSQQKGEPRSLTADIQSVKLERAGESWWTTPSIVLDANGLTLELRTRDGEMLKLMMMSGTGMMSALGGGENQGQGVLALAEWVQQGFSPRS